jgi:UDP-glucuronate decarboxylase
VSNFIVQALTGQPLTIYGEGLQTRSFCYVDDLIEGCVRLMATPDDFTGPVNLGNPMEITVRELARNILRLTGSRSSLVYNPLPSDDPRRRQPDISLARDVLNWQPVAVLEEGLLKTIEYLDQLLSTPGYKIPSAVTNGLERHVA